jgi:pimeloyl-ACP methyl ester carboxylesterase
MTVNDLSARTALPAHHPIHFVEASGHRLEYIDLPAHQIERPPLILLHEGLGSVSMWREFPAQLAAVTGCRTVAYSRYGFGRSSPRREPYNVRFMHDESLNVLPELRAKLRIERPVLIGHSTGASMSLIHAGAGNWEVAGVVVMAPLCFVEEFNLESIRNARTVFETTDMKQKLARYHDDAEAVFWGWNDIWLNPDFKTWSLEEYLPGIRCPVLGILGEDDEYSTRRQLDLIAHKAVNSPDVDLLYLADCRHSPHRDQPEVVLEAITHFIDGLEDREPTT